MYEQLSDILTNTFQVPIELIEPTATLDDMGLDSLDLAELAVVIEKEMGVRLSDDELIEDTRIQDVAELIIVRRSVA